MKPTFLKSFGALLAAAGLTLAGVVAPAQATGNLTVDATGASSTIIGTTGTNNAGINITFTTVTAGADNFTVEIPAGWSAVNINTLCSNVSMAVQGGNTGTSCAAVTTGGGGATVTITKTSGTWVAPLSMTATFATGSLNVTSGRTFTVRTYTGSTPVDLGTGVLSSGGGGGGSSITSFTVANATLVDSNSTAITSWAASTAVPAFTATASGFSNSATVGSFNIVVSNTNSTEYFSVLNALNTSGSNPGQPSAWDPGSATCGITAVLIGGAAQTGSSGITCMKNTWSMMGTSGYGVRVTLPSQTSSSISVSVADGVFTSGTAGNYNFRLALSGTGFQGNQNIPVTVGGSTSTSSLGSSSDTLASTGFNGMPWLAAGNALGVLGVAVLLLSARRRQHS